MSIGASERGALAYPASPNFTSIEQLEGLAFRVPLADLGASVAVANSAVLDYELIPHATGIQKRGEFSDAAIPDKFDETSPFIDIILATPDEAKALASDIRLTSELRGTEGSASYYGADKVTSLIFFNTTVDDTRLNQSVALEQHVPVTKRGRIGETLVKGQFEVVLAQAVRTTTTKAVRAALLARANPEQDTKAKDEAIHRANRIAAAVSKTFFPKVEELKHNVAYTE